MTAAWRTRGQPAALAAVARWVAQAAVPHALLLVGPAGSGKTTLATDLAAALLCTALEVGDRPCGACAACRRVAHGNHPDLHRLAPAGAGRQIRIGERVAPEPDTIRGLTHDLALAPLEGAWRVAIIEGAERMNENSQNALLKLLEEPPPGTALILCASEEDVLLPTVRSRCVRLRLAAVPPGDIAAMLAEDGVDPHRAATLARLADGSPGRARALAASPDAVLVHEQLVRELLDLSAKGRAERLAAAAHLLAAADQLASALGPGSEGTEPATGTQAGGATAGPRRGSRARSSGVPSGQTAAGAAAAVEAAGGDAGPDEAAFAGPRERQAPAARRRAVIALGGLWRSLARDVALAVRGGRAELRHVALLEELVAVAASVPPGSAERFLARLDRLLPTVEQNANPELVLDVLLLEWPLARRAA